MKTSLTLVASSWVEREGVWSSTLTATIANGLTEKSYRLALGGEGGAMIGLPSISINGVPMTDYNEETFFISNVGGDLHALKRGEVITVSGRLYLREGTTNPSGFADLFVVGSGAAVAVATIPLAFKEIYTRRECKLSADELAAEEEDDWRWVAQMQANC